MHWLGYDWGTDLYYASDYFERLYEWAEGLIKAGHAYVDDQSQEEIRLDARHADRTRQEQPVPRPHRWTRTSTCSAA